MSLQELWDLFPIQLTEHQICWGDWYQSEKDYLLSILPVTVQINHIGSTAIRGIWAKPIIDILLEANIVDHTEIQSILCQNGYICMLQSGNRIDFNKGYTPKGFAEKVFHLHLRGFGDNDELYFRDYLREYPEIARAYEQFKLSLQKEYKHNRDGYTERKTAFVRKYTLEAIASYGRKYSIASEQR